ncbi:14030_t:CDS:2 [Ambispora leptoticha]|uniref:14030_t:CDS:1 n=1 Tax=Ambispora leptoticha TaxID=144679 RepID=A0A9N8WI59_9GLOM|nr:14030_t:CDS:2 [Ambispora leptoticha]
MVADEAIFQENNAQIYKSNHIKELKNNLGITTMEWPTKSPVQLKICEKKLNIGFVRAIFATWNAITFEKILYFIDSMPELVKAAIHYL